MSGSADRLPRLLALVPYLMSHPGAQVGEVADVFGLSEKQLIDDLQLVWMCGLPGHTPGDLIDVSWDGGEILIDNADTIARPLRLGIDEASALLVALRMLAATPELAEVPGDALPRVTAKLERAAGEGAATVSTQVAVDVDAAPDALPRVREGLTRGRRLSLRYYVQGRDEVTPREVDPMRVVVVDGRAYLEGWCYRAEAMRLFRLDRVLGVDVLDVPADPPAEAEPRDVTAGVFRPSPTDELVELELSAAGRWVAEYYPCEQVTELGEGRLRVALRARDEDWILKLALRLGDTGRVVSPPDMAETVREEAERALALYAHHS
ncbi:helix-turn-helix transcriptional regulator [Nonomuraea gerenzanensis]|uniref:FIG019733: possible DNA-binding protein n=1 Tax=Nonomuraea gerenzanensis TaxID=93944 RepID=A0A1M4EH50_9ACTN|nr:WYL domain-containing protein [Nonomuraea gerenzanensis]UBU09577.1 WYL domain-containing protein [Nonomuraea gerenzanensis]SBO97998.1 FIG019733: possible DNA-binding protein [Nonomuraea gerenzanensis]